MFNSIPTTWTWQKLFIVLLVKIFVHDYKVRKIESIKFLRRVLNLGLRQAKDAFEYLLLGYRVTFNHGWSATFSVAGVLGYFRASSKYGFGQSVANVRTWVNSVVALVVFIRQGFRLSWSDGEYLKLVRVWNTHSTAQFPIIDISKTTWGYHISMTDDDGHIAKACVITDKKAWDVCRGVPPSEYNGLYHDRPLLDYMEE